MPGRLGAVVVVAILAFAGAGVVVAPAGAQTERVFSCSYVVGPTTLPPGGGFVTVEGTAPGASVVRIFADGVQVAVTDAAPVTGAFSADVFVTGSVEITVGVDGYPSIPCVGVGGASVTRGAARGAVTGAGARGLARTGSSDTGTVVLVGLGALSLGLVLVVAARRRGGIRGRA